MRPRTLPGHGGQAGKCEPEAECGNGLIEPSEGCDDGNSNPGDGCDDRCEKENGWTCTEEPSICETRCGDGITAGSEECDDGTLNSDTQPDACRTDCKEPICNDGVTDPSNEEECDDGNINPGDGCDEFCQLECIAG